MARSSEQESVSETDVDAPDSDFVQSFERGLRVIRAFAFDSPVLTLSEVARRTDLTRASARRFLLTLERIGYVQHEQGRFSLRPRVLELGSAYASSLGLPDVARTHVQSLMNEVGESVAVAILDDLDIVHVVSERPRRIMGLMTSVGTRLPAHLTSMGRVLLAALPPDVLEERIQRIQFEQVTRMTVTDAATLRTILDRVRGQGWALVDRELEIGLRAIAVPLRNASGEQIAAINVATFTGHVALPELTRRLLPALQRVAAAIQEDLRHLEGRRVSLPIETA